MVFSTHTLDVAADPKLVAWASISMRRKVGKSPAAACCKPSGAMLRIYFS